MHDLWRVIFGNDGPVEVEIGPGTGAFLLAAAQRWPQVNFFGVEHSRKRAARLQAAIELDGLPNARAIAADAACVVSTLLPPLCVAAYHIYFPDPWWKRRHHRRRFFTPEFAAALVRTLVARGRISVATDVDAMYALAVDTLGACPDLTRDPEAPSPRLVRTTFECKGLARGATIKEAVFVKRERDFGRTQLHTNSAAPMTPAESPS